MIEITYSTASGHVITNSKVTSITYYGDGMLQINIETESPLILPPSKVILIRASTPPPIRRRRSHK